MKKLQSESDSVTSLGKRMMELFDCFAQSANVKLGLLKFPWSAVFTYLFLTSGPLIMLVGMKN